jgi:hypothetical protein
MSVNGDHPEQDELGHRLREAIAAYYGVEVDAVLAFVVACERIDPEGDRLALSSVWSSETPVWRLEAVARELLHALEQRRRAVV